MAASRVAGLRVLRGKCVGERKVLQAAPGLECKPRRAGYSAGGRGWATKTYMGLTDFVVCPDKMDDDGADDDNVRCFFFALCV